MQLMSRSFRDCRYRVPVVGRFTAQRNTTVPGDSGKFTEPGVTWKVNNIAGGDPSYGTIDVNGLYTAPLAIPLSGQATVTAVSQVDTPRWNINGELYRSSGHYYGRFLDQSTFGPTPQLMAHIHQTGIQGFLDEQFLMRNLRCRRRPQRQTTETWMRSSITP